MARTLNKRKIPKRCKSWQCRLDAKIKGFCWFHFRQWLKKMTEENDQCT